MIFNFLIILTVSRYIILTFSVISALGGIELTNSHVLFDVDGTFYMKQRYCLKFMRCISLKLNEKYM